MNASTHRIARSPTSTTIAYRIIVRVLAQRGQRSSKRIEETMGKIVQGSVWGIMVLLGGGSALAGNGIAIEATNKYSGCGGSSLSHNIQNVEGLTNGMTPVSGVSWSTTVELTDPNAWDIDWLDPNAATGGDDDSTTDTTATAIAMYSGHGTCNEWTTQLCTNSSSCNSPAAGQSLPGKCSGVFIPRCDYFVPRQAVTCGDGDSFGHVVDLTDGHVRFGESTSSGGWAGAGTNGNVNLVVMDISCGATPGQETNEYWNAFAGAHILSTVMPVEYGSDTLDVSNRGAALAARYRANVNGSASIAWLDAMNAVSGGTCEMFPGGTYGGHGISGCGAYISYSVAENQSWAQFLNGSESWAQLQDDNNDAFGAGFMAWTYTCNYNCSIKPFLR